MDTALLLLSLISFAALIIVWITAPLHADSPALEPIPEAVSA